MCLGLKEITFLFLEEEPFIEQTSKIVDSLKLEPTPVQSKNNLVISLLSVESRKKDSWRGGCEISLINPLTKNNCLLRLGLKIDQYV